MIWNGGRPRRHINLDDGNDVLSRLTLKVKVYMVGSAFTYRLKDMRTVARLVYRTRLRRKFGRGSWDPINSVCRRIDNNGARTMGIDDLKQYQC